MPRKLQGGWVMERFRELDGPALFVGVTVALTLVASLLFLPVTDPADLGAGAMLRTSIIYVVVVAWPPLVALAIVRRIAPDIRPPDDGIRAVAKESSIVALTIALFTLVAAFAVEGLLLAGDGRVVPVLFGEASLRDVAKLLVTFIVFVAVLWIQAIIEEIAWRGYMLPRLMRTLGAWPGLLVHGFVWGLSYSPLFALSGASPMRALAYVVTCTLLGVVLGLLRLGTRSIYASATANATLTIGAGLPLLLVGQPTRFSAAFEPPGWVPLIVLVGAIVWYRPWRLAIRVP